MEGARHAAAASPACLKLQILRHHAHRPPLTQPHRAARDWVPPQQQQQQDRTVPTTTTTTTYSNNNESRSRRRRRIQEATPPSSRNAMRCDAMKNEYEREREKGLWNLDGMDGRCSLPNEARPPSHPLSHPALPPSG